MATSSTSSLPQAPTSTCIVLPKVTDASHVHALDLLLTQLELTHGLPVGRIGVDAQIEDAKGLSNIGEIAAAPRVQALVLGPADLMASLNMRTLVVGEQPAGYDVGDAYHHVLMTILVAARAHGVAAIDGPYLKVRDVEAFRRVAGRSAALGYDGKWVLHPDQIAAGNEIFSPRQEEYDRAELILEAYRVAHLEGRRRPRRGDARRRDDRRGQPQDGAGGRRQGPRRRDAARGRAVRPASVVVVRGAAGDDEHHERDVEKHQHDDHRADRQPGDGQRRSRPARCAWSHAWRRCPG